jgi:hypothetical protein
MSTVDHTRGASAVSLAGEEAVKDVLVNSIWQLLQVRHLEQTPLTRGKNVARSDRMGARIDALF